MTISRCLIMGVINATPDSFSGDGLVRTIGRDDIVDRAVAQARDFIRDGADILDIGGESSRPGAAAITETEEIARVAPVIAAVAAATAGTKISVDTCKPAVARAALRAGAQIINDISGAADPEMARLMAESGAQAVLMHNRSRPGKVARHHIAGNAWRAPDYRNFMEELRAEMLLIAERAEQAGIRHDSIILDPGIGFGKTVTQNMIILNRLDELTTLGYPLLIGPSRKSFIGHILNLPPEERLEGTAAAVAVGVVRGAGIVRVHDVRAMRRIVTMMEAILRADGRESD